MYIDRRRRLYARACLAYRFGSYNRYHLCNFLSFFFIYFLVSISDHDRFCQHHSHSTQVHITVNNLVKVPIPRGSSNTPEVITARGRVHLSTPPLPRPKFTRSILDAFSSSPAPVTLPKPKALPTKKSVQLQSSTSPPCFASRSKLKLKSPPPPAKQKDFSDIDAEGDTDQEKDGLRASDSTHPFFNPIKFPTKSCDNTPKIILVENSDNERAEDAHRFNDKDPTGEDTDKVLHVEKWNTPKYVFGLYLLRFMDPLGGPYDDVDASFFEKKKEYDPFENGNDPIVEPKKRIVEEAYEDIGEEAEDEEEENEHEHEQGDDIGEHEDADSEDAEVDEDEDEDDYEEAEIKTELTTQNPPSEFEYTPDLASCASPSSSLPPSSPGPGLGILSSPSLYSNSFANSSSHSLFDGSAYSDYSAHSDSVIILEEYTYTPAPPKKRKHRLRIKSLEKKQAKIKNLDFCARMTRKLQRRRNRWTSWLSRRRPLKIMRSQYWKRVKYGIRSVMNPRFEMIPIEARGAL